MQHSFLGRNLFTLNQSLVKNQSTDGSNAKDVT